MKERTYRLTGLVPLVLHNARLSDPLDKWTRLVAEISSKRKKTEADLMEMARREWFGGLYLNDDDKIIMPSQNLERMIMDAAKATKMGQAVQKALIVPSFEGSILSFPGQRKSLDALWDSGDYSLRASCKVRTSRVMRTRPMIPEWSLEFTAQWDEDVIKSTQEVDDFVELGGRMVGLGDWRPKYGRFTMEVVK